MPDNWCLFSIVAIDGQGAQSSALEYNIVLCDGCGSHGECDYETTTALSGLAKRAGCNCQTGYSGIIVNEAEYRPSVHGFAHLIYVHAAITA